jgi:hypothetical protein
MSHRSRDRTRSPSIATVEKTAGTTLNSTMRLGPVNVWGPIGFELTRGLALGPPMTTKGAPPMMLILLDLPTVSR